MARIVAVGASAGGLAPLEAFLANVPPHSGLAYIVVQHLDPTHKALLTEILQRATTLPVREARQNMRIEPDSVYVIRPDTELTIVDGTLNLTSPVEPRGMRLPINVLFSSLASNQGELAIAVVLSGMGSDGTLGLQAIKAVGGLTLVQQPDTAQFASMPESAIASGCADIIAPAARIPGRILAYLEKFGDTGEAATGHPDQETEPLQQILELLLKRTGHDFSLYKPSTLHRRVERRMAIHDLSTMSRYAGYLQDNPQESELLFKELLIGVTSFFRDPAVWEHFAHVALPDLMASRTTERKLRAWVVGCSTGEEPYSLAMTFAEIVRQHPEYADYTLQVFASDLSPDAIDTARRGRYPETISAAISRERLEQFFTATENGYEIVPEIRAMVLFAQQDVLLDPPFTKLDVISCRNLLIYFDASLQRGLIPLFHYSLRPGGLLMLGTAETIGQFNNLFKPVQANLRIYTRQDNVANGGSNFMLKAFPSQSRRSREIPMTPSDQTPSDNLQAAANQVLLQVHAPAAVVVNTEGDILYISGRTGKYLEPAAGKANWNIHAMVREGLRAPISKALKLASNPSETQQLHGLKVQLPGGGEQWVDVTVQSFREPAALQGSMMIVFRDVTQPLPAGHRRKGKSAGNTDQEAELRRHHEELQVLQDEARVTREELQSANEELQSTNEELQSTNEELTTEKEEMQSMSEELQTINAELQSKLDELALAQSDMSNLLNSIEIAILFLDQNLNVRRYTERARRIINIRESDVGRPFSDLTTNLQYPELHEDAIETLRTLTFSEKQILTTDSRWYTVRIMPYRRLDNVIDGVVLTFVDISATKELEQALRNDANA